MKEQIKQLFAQINGAFSRMPYSGSCNLHYNHLWRHGEVTDEQILAALQHVHDNLEALRTALIEYAVKPANENSRQIEEYRGVVRGLKTLFKMVQEQ